MKMKTPKKDYLKILYDEKFFENCERIRAILTCPQALDFDEPMSELNTLIEKCRATSDRFMREE